MLKNYPLMRSLALYRYMPFRFLLTVLLFVIANVGLALQQYYIGHAIDLLKHGSLYSFSNYSWNHPLNPWYWFVVLCAIAMVRALVQYLAGLSALSIGQQLLSTLREKIFSQVQYLDVTWHWKHGLGEVISRSTRDADKLKEALINFWRQVFESILVVVVTIGLLCWYNIWLGLVPLIFILIGIAVLFKLTNHLVMLDHQVALAYTQVSELLAQSIHGMRVVKAFGLENHLSKRFHSNIDQFIQHSMHALVESARKLPLPQMIIACSYIWVIAYGAYLIAHQQLEVGAFVASVLMANLLVFRIESVGQVLHIFADARSSAARIWNMLDEKSSIVEATEWCIPLPIQSFNIRFENVSLQAEDSKKYILKNCNAEFKSGQIITIVGQTASGKTTMMNLLNRFIDPTEGRVLLGSDQLGWVDIKTLKLSHLRNLVQIIPQEAFFFTGTLAENLSIAKPEVTKEQMINALHLACASELLQRFEHGLNTRIGDKGVTLSGGQKQRIALARAILKNTPVLAMDDSTSALDASTERTVFQRLTSISEQIQSSRTLIINSNKPSTIALSDWIIVLEHGEIIAQGRHEELLNGSDLYRKLMGFSQQQESLPLSNHDHVNG
ncbi:MAG: ABC transporter ATP-binding protein [Acinetobacter sp.]